VNWVKSASDGITKTHPRRLERRVSAVKFCTCFSVLDLDIYIRSAIFSVYLFYFFFILVHRFYSDGVTSLRPSVYLGRFSEGVILHETPFMRAFIVVVRRSLIKLLRSSIRIAHFFYLDWGVVTTVSTALF